MICRDIISVLEKLAPREFIEDWDNSGLQLGSLNKEINKLMISMDITKKSVSEAISKDIDMIITHHPLIFKPLSSISSDDNTGKMIYDLISKDVVVYSAHSNLDLSEKGVTEALAKKLEVNNLKLLSEVFYEKLFKLVAFVPKSHQNSVRDAVSWAGAGHIGNYSHCTFNTEGIGTFMPREGSDPYIGRKDVLERVEEVKIETIVKNSDLNRVISNMIKAHPYEEVAYDIYPLYNSIKRGYGKIGTINKSVSLKDLASMTKDILSCESVRVYGDLSKKVSKVALCGGRGADFIVDAYKKGADVYITGDVKYHDAQLAYGLGLPLIDANHYDTEKMILYYLKDYFYKYLDDVEILIYDNNDYSFITI